MDFSWSVQEIIVLVVAALASYWAAVKLTYKGPPTVGWIPYIGCWYDFFADPNGFLLKIRKKHGDVVNMYMGGTTYTCVFDESYLPKFYKTAEDKLSFSGAFTKTGTSVVIDPHNRQAQARAKRSIEMQQLQAGVMGIVKRNLVPRLTKFQPLFQPEIDEYLNEHFVGDSGEVDSGELYIQLIGRMSARVLCGRDVSTHQRLIRSSFALATLLRKVRPTLPLFWGYYRKEAKALHAELDSILIKSVHERRKWQAEDPENWLEKHGCDDLMSAYVEGFKYKDGMNEEKKKQMDTLCLVAKQFLFAAMVNTTQGTQYTLLRILADPELKAAVVKEIDEVLREGGGKLQENAAKKLKLLDACFLEHTRTVSDTRQLRTVVNKPFELKGYVLDVGSVICISPYIQSHSDKNFSDPMKFDPQRMIDGVPKGSDYKYLPFSAGKHKCLGQPMAQMESQLTIAGLLKDFDVEIIPGSDGVVLPDPDYTRGTLALPKRPVSLRWTRRKTPLGA